MTADCAGMYDCVPPSANNDKVIVDGLEMLPITCYGKLYLVFHSIENVVVTLNTVAHVPGLGVNLFFSSHRREAAGRDH